MDILNNDQVRKINKVSLAEKHHVTREYVSMVLRGERNSNTEKAKAILEDGQKLIKILEQ